MTLDGRRCLEGFGFVKQRLLGFPAVHYDLRAEEILVQMGGNVLGRTVNQSPPQQDAGLVVHIVGDGIVGILLGEAAVFHQLGRRLRALHKAGAGGNDSVLGPTGRMIGQLIAAFRTDAAGDLPPAAGTGVRRLIGGGLSLPRLLSQQHIVGRHMELFAQRGDGGGVRRGLAALPLADGLPGDTQQLAQLLLGQSRRFADGSDTVLQFHGVSPPFLWSHHTEKAGAWQATAIGILSTAC